MDNSDTLLSTRVLLTLTLVLLILLVTAVNLIVWMVTRLSSVSNDMFKHCLATIVFANLIAVTFCLPAQLLYISLGKWTFGTAVCIFTITLDSVTFVTVTWFLVVLVMDRIFTSSLSQIYLTFRKKHTRAVHVLIWAILMLLTLPFFLVEFLKLDNDVSRLRCHVPFHSTATLFLIMFGFVIPLSIIGFFLTYLWLRIIKSKLAGRKKVSAMDRNKYVLKSETRTVTPWGKNWLLSIDERVSKGPNNVLPPLRRHSVAECDQEMNEDLPEAGSRERRISLPEGTVSQEMCQKESLHYSVSFDKKQNKEILSKGHTNSMSWVKMGNILTRKLPDGKETNLQNKEACERKVMTPADKRNLYQKNVLYLPGAILDQPDLQECQICDQLGQPANESSLQVGETGQQADLPGQQNNPQTYQLSQLNYQPGFKYYQQDNQSSLPVNQLDHTDISGQKTNQLGQKTVQSVSNTNQLGQNANKPGQNANKPGQNTDQSHQNSDQLGQIIDQPYQNANQLGHQDVAELEIGSNREVFSHEINEQLRHPPNPTFFGDLVSVPLEKHLKDNMWVKGSRSKLDSDFDNNVCDDSNNDDDDGDYEVQVTVALSVMFGFNIILWLPHLCMFYLQVYCDTCQVRLDVWILLKVIGQISLITNPVCLLFAVKDWKPLLKYVLSGFGTFSYQCFQRW